MLITVLFTLLIALSFAPEWHIKNQKYQLTKEQIGIIKLLGDSAIQTLDVPVVCLLLYNGKLIATGYNTVNRNHTVSGHAEINAISNAINILGIDAFNKLDRRKLYLITTFEPCKMCEGAIVENYIKHVVMLKEKSMKHWYKNWKLRIQYQWNKKQTDTDTLQESLFEKHPYFDKSAAQY